MKRNASGRFRIDVGLLIAGFALGFALLILEEQLDGVTRLLRPAIAGVYFMVVIRRSLRATPLSHGVLESDLTPPSLSRRIVVFATATYTVSFLGSAHFYPWIVDSFRIIVSMFGNGIVLDPFRSALDVFRQVFLSSLTLELVAGVLVLSAISSLAVRRLRSGSTGSGGQRQPTQRATANDRSLHRLMMICSVSGLTASVFAGIGYLLVGMVARRARETAGDSDADIGGSLLKVLFLRAKRASERLLADADDALTIIFYESITAFPFLIPAMPGQLVYVSMIIFHLLIVGILVSRVRTGGGNRTSAHLCWANSLTCVALGILALCSWQAIPMIPAVLGIVDGFKIGAELFVKVRPIVGRLLGIIWGIAHLVIAGHSLMSRRSRRPDDRPPLFVEVYWDREIQHFYLLNGVALVGLVTFLAVDYQVLRMLNIPLGFSSHTGNHLPEFVVSFVLEH
ncbi:hypothetical protein KAW44_07915 [Candidatus Bipolaricaulota bacterium]|nr:hypothetical protein [Candidatus Bipolaricaulota bacterium]